MREQADGRLEIGLSPTYTGCPATAVIRRMVEEALTAALLDATCTSVLSPPWSSDWITPEGRRKLLEYGIVPPESTASSIRTHLLEEMDGSNQSLQDVEMLRIVAAQSTAERALLGVKLAREDVETGITTVRDVWNSGVNGDVALRRAIERGWVPGPRMVTSTRALAAQGGQLGTLTPAAQALIEQEYAIVRGPESARQAVRQALYDGATCIIVIANGSPAHVTLDEMKAIVEEAHISGVKEAVHAVGDKVTRIAAEAGVDSIEHASTIPDDVLKVMVDKQIFLVPTDGTVKTFVDMSFGMRQPTTKERAELEKEYAPFVKREQERIKRAIQAGVPIAAGSDMYETMPGRTRGKVSLWCTKLMSNQV